MPVDKRILVTGATGYVGGRLLPLLVEDGWRVRCLARQPERLSSRVPAGVEVVLGDVLDAASLSLAMQGVEAAYYLVHSMGSTGDFEEQDRLAADTFAAAASAAGVRRIIYLGGLGEDKAALSAHLRSRHEVGERLRAHGVPVIELRASIIIGSGSLSFEMIRALVERLPVMVTPRWVQVTAQPIAIGDVLDYLRAALTVETDDRSPIIEIGGPDQVTYGELMHEYARQRGLRRWMIPVPLLTPHLSSLWLGLVTPLYARVGRKLIDSLRHSTVVRDDAAQRLFSIRPIGVREAIASAHRNEDSSFAQTRWSDALSAAGEPRQWGGVRFGNRLVDSRSTSVAAESAAVFAAVERIGGATGWYYANWLWILRGWLDLLLGGVGLRRGRRDPQRVLVGDTLDFWRVEDVEPGKRLRLSAEMKLPGRAWLEFEVQPLAGGAELRQTATFDPLGLLGLAYWYAVWPLHQLVFAGMLRGIAQAALRLERKHVSRASIEIEASNADVWDALVNPATAKAYFFGAEVHSDWKEGSPITFTGEFNGNAYHEKGTILQYRPERLLKYSHWSDLEQLPDLPENYRNWTFRIESGDPGVVLSVAEDNIPDEAKRARSDEFWSGVLSTIKEIVEART